MAQTKVVIYEWQDGRCLGLWVNDQLVETGLKDRAEVMARLYAGLGVIAERRVVTGQTMHIASKEDPQ